MRVAFIGQKGLPATSGGVERHVEELASHLVLLGHDVTVFSRRSYSDFGTGEFRGVNVVELPTIASKHLDAIVHSFVSTVYCLGRRFDVVHYQGVGPCLMSPLSRLRRGITVATIHAEDWRQAKWGSFARMMLRIGEFFALRVPARTVVISQLMGHGYQRRGFEVTVIPNGVSLNPGADDTVLSDLGIDAGEYCLFVGRLIPDKAVHELIEAWGRAGIEGQLVIAGESSNTDDYANTLRKKFAGQCVFAGAVYGERLASLYRNCGLFVLPSHVEGLPIVLLEALGYEAAILASDLAENREVLGDSGLYYRVGDVEDLRGTLVHAWGARENLRERAAHAAPIILSEYDWRAISVETADLYRSAFGSADS